MESNVWRQKLRFNQTPYICAIRSVKCASVKLSILSNTSSFRLKSYLKKNHQIYSVTAAKLWSPKKEQGFSWTGDSWKTFEIQNHQTTVYSQTYKFFPADLLKFDMLYFPTFVLFLHQILPVFFFKSRLKNPTKNHIILNNEK